MTDLPPSVRAAFKVADRQLYLDSAHQTPMCDPVRDAIARFCEESSELAGPKPVWLARAEETRARAAALYGASPDEIAFTKNTSEGLNVAAHALPLERGDAVLMIEGDHPNNAYAWLNRRNDGVEVRTVPLADAEVANADTFAPHVDDRTRVITLSHVSFHAGQRHDLESIGRLCAERGIWLVVDAMQSSGVVPIDVERMNIAMLASGCHKGLLVPQGLGLLYAKRALMPLLSPAYLAMAGLARPPSDYIARPDDLALRDDAGRFELGNLSLPHLHALTASLDFIASIGVDRIEAQVLALGDRLIAQLDRLGIDIVGPRAREGRAHIVVMALDPAQWQARFAEHRVRVSPERGGVRVSFGMFNTEDDVDRLVALLESRLGSSAVAA